MFIDATFNNKCKLIVKQGESYSLPFSFKIDGYTVTDVAVSDIIIYIGQMKKSFINQGLSYSDGSWYFPLSEEDTAAMRGRYIAQAKIILKSDQIFVSPEYEIFAEPTRFGDEI